MRYLNAPENFEKFKWTLLVTFLGVIISIMASYLGTGTLDPVKLLMGLIISVIVSLVTSRYEEIKYNSEMINSAIDNLCSVSNRFEGLISSVKVVPSNRAGMFTEAAATLKNLIEKHEKNDQTIPGSLLIVQRTPTPIFHSELQAQAPGYYEEKGFRELLDRAIALAKDAKIRMVFAFSVTEPAFREKIRQLLCNDPRAAERIRVFLSSFYGEGNSHKYWSNLRLYPMENRRGHPFMVADDVVEMWVEETEDDRTYIRAVDRSTAGQFFEKYWTLTGDVQPAKARRLLLAFE